jgi:hypothetical protein
MMSEVDVLDPQPDTGRVDGSRGVQIVQFAGFRRCIGRVWRADVLKVFRELDPKTGEIVGLEFWHASRELPADFLHMLPPPQVEIAA